MKNIRQISIPKIFFECRFKRTLFPLVMMLVPIALSGAVTPQVVAFAVMLTLMYGAVSLHNSWVDHDVLLSKGEFYLGYYGILLINTIIAFCFNLLGVLALYVFLGLLYNTISRRILLGDMVIMMFTHSFIPMYITGNLLGIGYPENLLLASINALLFFTLGNIRNFKGYAEDIGRGYKTIATVFPVDSAIKVMCGFIVAGLLISLIPLLFVNLNWIFFVFLAGFIGCWVLTYRELLEKNFRKTLSMLRFSLQIYPTGLVLSMSSNYLLDILVVGLLGLYWWSDFITKHYG